MAALKLEPFDFLFNFTSLILVIKKYFEGTTEWNIELVDTGLDTMTGGRIKRIQDHYVTFACGQKNMQFSCRAHCAKYISKLHTFQGW